MTNASATVDLHPRAQPWLVPFGDSEPAGMPARSAPGFDSLSREMSKLDSPVDVAVAWDVVARTAGGILQRSSRDLLVAAHFAYATFVTEGLPGLVTGAAVLVGMLQHHWEAMFPEATRLRGRARALGWFVGRVTPRLGTQAVGPEDLPVLVELTALFESMAALARARFEGESPAFAPLLAEVSRLRMSLPAPPPEDVVEPAPPLPSEAPSSTPDVNPPVALQSPEAAEDVPAKVTAPSASAPIVEDQPRASAESALALPATALGVGSWVVEVGATLDAGAALLFAADPADAHAYRLRRVGAWLGLDALPAADRRGRTALSPLDPSLRAALDEAHEDDERVLALAEAALLPAPLALALQGYVVRALGRLGGAYEPARLAVLTEVRALLLRLPGLATLSFRDGTPVLDDQTRLILELDVDLDPRVGEPTPLPNAGAPDMVSAEPAAPEFPAAADDAIAEAVWRAQEGNLADALRGLEQAGHAAGSDEVRFRHRLLAAELALEAHKLGTARALFELLDVEATRRDLASWEPTLAGAALAGYLRTLRALEESGQDPDLALQTRLVQGLARVDMAALLTLDL